MQCSEVILDRVESTLALATCTIGLDTRYAPPFTHSLDQSVHHIRRTHSLDVRKSVIQHVAAGVSAHTPICSQGTCQRYVVLATARTVSRFPLPNPVGSEVFGR